MGFRDPTDSPAKELELSRDLVEEIAGARFVRKDAIEPLNLNPNKTIVTGATLCAWVVAYQLKLGIPDVVATENNKWAFVVSLKTGNPEKRQRIETHLAAYKIFPNTDVVT